MKSGKRPRFLAQSREYLAEWTRLPSKYRNQVSRKVHDLTVNPEPGGSRTTLMGYDKLCRLRAGDFRIIYAYDDKVVQLISLRRRDERTYDDLDDSEVQQLEEFESIRGNNRSRYKISDWEEWAKKKAEPKVEPPELLPVPITEKMLEKLGVAKELRTPLLEVKTADELLDCQGIPLDVMQQVLDHVCQGKEAIEVPNPVPVVELADLVDPVAADVSGPIDAAEPKSEEDEEHVSRGRKAVTNEKSGLPVHVRPGPLVVVTRRQQEAMKPYRGNTSKGIGKETSYTVKLNRNIQLVYSVGNNERALLTTDEHAELVDMVNEAKRRGGSSQDGGRFLINEYRHVLVPVQSGEMLYAGVYTRDLEFKFEGALISPVAPPTIAPGDVWPGPHAGIRYTLSAGGNDVRYEAETARGTLKKVFLRDHHSEGALDGLLRMLRKMKPSGGAIYVNEARELFAPVDDGKGYKRRYIGHLGKMPWFPDPT